MTGILEVFFVLQFIGVIGIMLFKLYNVMFLGEIIRFEFSFILLIVFILCYGIGLNIVMIDSGSTLLFNALFKIEAWIFIIAILLFFFEIVFFIKSLLIPDVESFRSNGRK